MRLRLIAQVQYELSRNFLIKDELVRAVGRGGPPFF
jgi:hypothetical protein